MTTTEPRPWWASDGPEREGDPTVDPVTAHRAARRRTGPAQSWTSAHDAPDAIAGDRVSAGPVADGPGPGGAQEQSDDPQQARTAAGPTGHDPDVCGACPLCAVARALGETRPELVDHLAEAARHLLAAFRTFVDAARDGPEAPRRSDERVRRIDID
jgi:hypothetical protein